MQVRFWFLDDQDIACLHNMAQIEHHGRKLRDHGRCAHQRQILFPAIGPVEERWIVGLGGLHPHRAREQVLFELLGQAAYVSGMPGPHVDELLEKVRQHARKRRHVRSRADAGHRSTLNKGPDNHLVAVHDAGSVGRQIVCLATSGT